MRVRLTGFTALPKVPSSRSIAFLVSHSSAGGAQELWANLADGFRQRGYNVSLLALYPLRKDVRETNSELTWDYLVPVRPSNAFSAMRLLKAATDFFRKNSPCIVFTAMPAANVLATVAVRLSRARTRVITSHHSPVGTHNQILNWVDSITGSMRNVISIISVSEFVSGSLEQKPSRYKQKRRTIKNALPTQIEETIVKLRASRIGRRTSRIAVATGRLAPQKNYPLIIRAAAKMRDVQIKIVGAGPDEAQLRALAHKLNVQDRVQFLGQRTRTETLRLLAESDIFLQPSLFEGHSLGLIEAAKLGLPLIVSNIPVQIEAIVSKAGTLSGIPVGLNDDVELATQVERLLDDPAVYAQYAALSSQLYSEITFDLMLDQYLDLVSSDALRECRS